MYHILTLLVACTSLTAQVTHAKSIKNNSIHQINFSAPARKHTSHKLFNRKRNKQSTTLLTAQQLSISQHHKNKHELSLPVSLETKYENIAMIVEPRKHKLLESVIKNVHEHLNWPIILLHGTENVDFILASPYLHSLIEKNDLILSTTGVENFNNASYNNLMLSESTWQNIPAENILLFQTDAIVCGNTESLSQFLQYDYVGAPWNAHYQDNGPSVGNGGLSFRKRSAMIRATRNMGYKGGNEDVVFANLGYGYSMHLKKQGIRTEFRNLHTGKTVNNPGNLDDLGLLNIPAPGEAGKFAAETVFLHNKPFGVHNINGWFPDKRHLPEGFLEYCPDVNILYER